MTRKSGASEAQHAADRRALNRGHHRLGTGEQPYRLEIERVSGTVLSGRDCSAGGIVILRSPRRFDQAIFAVQKKSDDALAKIMCESAAMHEIRQKVQRFGPLDAPVLVTCETGAGRS